MNCEQATALISARLDREIGPDEARQLDDHLGECPACRATAEAFALQDQELRDAVGPRREGAKRVARSVAGQARPAAPPTPRPWLTRAIIGTLAMAAGVAALLLFRNQLTPVVPTPDELGRTIASSTLKPAPLDLTQQKRSTPLQVGDAIATGPAERQRRVLPDGSILYVDRGTKATITGDRTLTVERGNVYVEVAPSEAERFTVATPTREVVAHGTRFEVQVADQGTGVVVTQGKVKVAGLNDLLVAGQRLVLGKDAVEPAPRASHLLDWTQDLMEQAAAAFVPTSQHQGGSLIAFDTNGQEAKLSLRKYHIDVHIEDGFARTTIDQTYFNHHPWRLEGTFHFPLPADASLSQLTMYVNGDRQEGGMVERKQGRAIYNKIVSSMRDPALLEWVDGTTFKMRVFPLEGRQEKRILLSYTQRLPSLYGRATYRFPAGHSLQVVRDWSFQARVKDGQQTRVVCPSHPAMAGRLEGSDTVLSASEQNVKVDRDVVLHLAQGDGLARGESLQFRHMDHGGYRYLMARWRPELSMTASRQQRDWVFLFEASADRDPLLARVQIEVFRHLMSQAEHDDTFTVLAANSRVHRFGANTPASPENVAQAAEWLGNVHLVGALDLGQAFDAVGGAIAGLGNPHVVHLGSGNPGMGRGHDRLLPQIKATHAKYVGVGVGKRWARAFFKQAAEKTGGLVTQINPDEPIAWRTFELLATLNTPRLLGLTAAFEGPDQPAVLADQAMLAQGEDLCVVTRVPLAAGPIRLPAQLAITATLDGQPYRRVLNIDEGQGGAGYLPRQWARLEIDRLLADGAQKNQEAIIALSMDSYVMSPFTSLLVLENEAMYAEFKVERGRKDHWAAFAAPDKIPVVYEPDPTQIGDVANAPKDRKPGKAQVLNSVLFHVGAPLLRREDERDENRPVLAGLEIENLSDRAYFFGANDVTNLWSLSTGRAVDAGRLGRLNENDLDAYFGLMTDGSTNAIRNSDLGLDFGFHAPRFANHTNGVLAFNPDGRLLTNGELRESDFLSRGYRSRPRTEAASRNFFGRGVDLAAARLPALRAGNEVRAVKLFDDVDGLDNFRTTRFDREEDARVKLGEAFYARSRLEDRRRSGLFAESATPENLAVANDFDGGLRYKRLVSTDGPRRRDDLLAYAAGLNTTPADVKAVLEAEAEPELRNVPGRIDPEARALFDKARQGGWLRRGPAGKDAPAETFLFDPSGRYVRTRTLAVGLKEEVVCDGDTALTLYPEIGLAGRRTVTRHHRSELSAGLPHVVPAAADLARGHDLTVVGERTVALVPHSAGDKPHLQRRYVFAEDGALAERQVVHMPKGDVLLRQILLPDGVRVVGADGKELDRVKYALTPVEAPKLDRDLASLVVLDLPFRKRDVLFPKVGLTAGTSLDGENGCYRYLPREKALQVFVACCLERNANDAWRVLRDCFLERDDLRPGLLVLAASAGIDVGRHDRHEWFSRFVAAHPESEVVRYFAVLHNAAYADVRTYWPLDLTRAVGVPGGFVQRLARFHELYDRWHGRTSTLTWDLTRKAHFDQALAFIRERPGSPLSRALLARVQHHGNLPPGGWAALADAWKALDLPGERYRAKYERAACLLADRQIDAARKAFQDVAEMALALDVLPPIDDRFYRALSDPGPKNPWTAWVLATADRLVRTKKPAAVLDLADRCRDFGDPALADNLVAWLLDAVPTGNDRTYATVAVVDRLLNWGQADAAERHLAFLLKDNELRTKPLLYRLAARVAEARGQTERMFSYREKALDLEYPNLPEVLDLEAWRQDYRPLFEHYLARAQLLAELGGQADAAARDDLVVRTVRAIDRYRKHDPEANDACQKAGVIFRLLGADDLAWDYQTTPHAGRDEPVSLHGEAVGLARLGAFGLAERHFRVACDAEPTNAGVWWDRAQAHDRAGRRDAARAIYRDLAAGTHTPEDQLYRERAAWLLKR